MIEVTNMTTELQIELTKGRASWIQEIFINNLPNLEVYKMKKLALYYSLKQSNFHSLKIRIQSRPEQRISKNAKNANRREYLS
jgi:hypothetical protein